MKTRIEIKSMFLGAALGAIVMFSVAAATTHESTPWEYKTLRSGVSGEEFDRKLNNMADEGWTVVSSSTTQSTQTSAPYAVVILKREKMR